MATVYQPDGLNERISDRYDLFVRLNNGKSIRIEVRNDGVLICPINGVKMDIRSCHGGGATGILFLHQS